MLALNQKNTHITFCILTFNRTPWLKTCLSSIRKYCETDYSVKILSQGPPDTELTEYIAELRDNRFELIISAKNTGCSGGRKLLAQRVTSSLMMMLDDDMYLTDGCIAVALNVLQNNSGVGVVSMPQYDRRGFMISPGGNKLVIRDGVIYRHPLNLDSSPWIELEDISGGATIFRTEMLDSFYWDEQYGSGPFEDLDKSLQILRAGKWKQAVVPNGRLTHDRSWIGKTPAYERTRFDASKARQNYRYFRRKWGLRLDMPSHFLFEFVYPAAGFAHFQLTLPQIDRITRAYSLLRSYSKHQTEKILVQPKLDEE